jgi:transcriptional regulator GlxA family with amidase domain
MTRPASADRTVVFTLFDGVQPLDVVGPHEVFAGANEVLDAEGRHDPRYRLVLAAAAAGPVASESGLELVATHTLRSAGRRPIDTLLLPGGNGVRAAASDGALVASVVATAARARRIVTVCSGTFIAGAAGLLDGRRCTTHWARADSLAARHPLAHVDADPIFVRDGNLWSSAGVTAGIDLSLALVQQDFVAEVAQVVARYLVVFLRRPGGQSQFAVPTWTRPAEREPIRAAQTVVHADPGADLSIPVLAEQVGLSARHFTRLFQQQVGVAPGRYVEKVRVEAARRLLETERAGVHAVAGRCGFGTAETMRRAFVRQLGVSPDQYRQRFAVAAS